MASSGDAQAAPPPADKGDDPFGRFAIASHAPLEALTTRQPCAGGSKTRKYFCYDCLTPMGDPAAVPRVALPCDVHVIKHPQEQNSKRRTAKQPKKVQPQVPRSQPHSQFYRTPHTAPLGDQAKGKAKANNNSK